MPIRDFFQRLLGVSKAEKPQSKPTPPPLRERFDDLEAAPAFSGKVLSELKDYIDLYGSHAWVHSCARDVAVAAASAEWQILKDGKEVKSDESQLGKLLKRPNPHDTWFDLIEKTFLHLELTGNAFWEVVRSPVDQSIIGIYPLKPHKIEIKPHPKVKIAGYIYTPNETTQILYDAEDVIHLRYVNPADDYWGMSVFKAATIAITLDFYSQSWNKGFFQKGAEPGGTLETDQSLSPQAYERLLLNWKKRHQGANNAHKIAILEEGLKYNSISMKHQEMQFVEMRKMTKEEIYEVAGVPVDRSNSAQKKAFWMENVIPKLQKIEQTINCFLMQPEGSTDKDKFQFKFVIRSILRAVEDEQVKAEICNQNVTHGIWTPNEAREREYGLGPVPWGDDWWAPVGLMPTKNPPQDRPDLTNEPGQTVTNDNQGGNRAGLSHPNQVPKLNQPSRLDQSRGAHPEVSKDYDGSQRVDIDKIEIPDPDFADKRAVWIWKRWTAWQKGAGRDERKLRKAVRDAFEDQYRGISNKLTHLWAKHTKGESGYSRITKGEAEKKIDNLIFELNLPEDDAAFTARLKKAGSEVFERQGNIVLAQMGVDVSFQPQNQRTIKFLDEWGATKVTQINTFTKELLKDKLVESAKAGADFDAMLSKIGDVFLPQGGISLERANKIARTELITLTNGSRLEAAQQTGVVGKKMWVSELLPTTRKEKGGANHAVMHGKVVTINEDFLVQSRSGVDVMNGPGDISGSPENVVNCLCILEFPPEDDSFAELFAEAVQRPDMTKKDKDQDVNVNINIKSGEASVEKPVEKTGTEGQFADALRKGFHDIADALRTRQPAVIHVKPTPLVVENKIPEQPAAQVTVNNEIPQAAAPVINNVMPEQPTPHVTVKNEVQSPDVKVTVNPELHTKPVEETITILRDERNPNKVTGFLKEIKEQE